MASPAAVRAAPAAGSPTNPVAQLGQGLWRLLTSVDFAVVQIIFLSILAVVGMTLQQLPDFAFRSPGDYATAMDEIRARYDPVIGPAAVGVLERDHATVQARIIAKVQHLMRLCDDLEAALCRAEDRASKLIEAVVQEMVG